MVKAVFRPLALPSSMSWKVAMPLMKTFLISYSPGPLTSFGLAADGGGVVVVVVVVAHGHDVGLGPAQGVAHRLVVRVGDER